MFKSRGCSNVRDKKITQFHLLKKHSFIHLLKGYGWQLNFFFLCVNMATKL